MPRRKRSRLFKFSWWKINFIKNSNTVSKFFYDFDEYRRRNKIFILALIIMAVIMLSWFLLSKTEKNFIELSFSPSKSTVTAGTNFNLKVNLDTKNNTIYSLKGILEYDPKNFELVAWNMLDSVFPNSEACSAGKIYCPKIRTNDGKIFISLAEMKTGINVTESPILNLTFRPLKDSALNYNSITMRYVASQDITAIPTENMEIMLDDPGFPTQTIKSEIFSTTNDFLKPKDFLSANILAK